MNSILEIGDKVIFLRLGKLEWQGNRKEIYTAQNEALEDFVFASELFKNVRKANS
jgi:phospholipid/cholesterol/gamma-HCH transport system ATP-binding protein